MMRIYQPERILHYTTYILPKYYSKSGKRIIRQIFPSFRNEMSCIQIEAQLLVGGYDDDKD